MGLQGDKGLTGESGKDGEAGPQGYFRRNQLVFED